LLFLFYLLHNVKLILFKVFVLVSLLGLCSLDVLAQRTGIQGHVRDDEKNPMEFVSVAVEGSSLGTTTDKTGFFQLQLPSNQNLPVTFSFLGFESQTLSINLSDRETRTLNITLNPSLTTLPDVEIRDKQLITSQYIRLDPKLTALLPGPGSGVENMIKTMPGVSSTSELSSQYSVRGGNFDENLVYVNGIEIYRPFLVRSGQQEGLSFINSDLVSSITFSAGGFDAEYGDKMASVLDIQYKAPEKFGGSFYDKPSGRFSSF
jgi:hypothetical protein